LYENMLNLKINEPQRHRGHGEEDKFGKFGSVSLRNGISSIFLGA
jgi:hypothetical protein